MNTCCPIDRSNKSTNAQHFTLLSSKYFTNLTKAHYPTPAALIPKTMVEVQQLIELIFCILLPPVAILLHGGLDILHLILNIVLCILGYVPGVIHALWYCFFS
ncbi:hypothetical protein GPALN_003404 [Globodera pallida]|nr:hypothetical protein GPALN_003404 [Globodera pallida]